MKKAFYVFIFLSILIGIDIAAHAEEFDQVPEEPINFQIDEIQEDTFTFQPIDSQLLSGIELLALDYTTPSFGYLDRWGVYLPDNVAYPGVGGGKIVYAAIPADSKVIITNNSAGTGFYWLPGPVITVSSVLEPITFPFYPSENGYIYYATFSSSSNSLPLGLDNTYVPPGSGGDVGDITVDVDLSEVVYGLETVNENILILTYICNNIVVLLVLLIFVPKVKALGRRLIDNHNTHV